MKIIHYLYIMLICISSVLAVTYNDAVVSSIGLNSTFYINKTLTCSALTVDATYIYFQACSDATTVERVNSTFNYTSVNETHYLNNARWDFPYISSSTAATKTLASNLTSSINATVVINANCGQIGNEFVEYVYYNGVIRSWDSCVNDQLTFNDLPISPGDNTFELVYYDRTCEYRENTILSFQTAGVWIGILLGAGGLVLLAGLLAGINMFNGDSNINWMPKFDGTIIITLLFVGLFIMVLVIAIASVNRVVC